MHFKKSATLLTLVAIPTAVTIVGDAPVSANTSYSYTSDYQVRNVEILIEQLNPYSSTFINDLYNIQTLYYTTLTYTQQSQVYNREILFSYSNSYWNGWNSTEYQTVINTFTTKVSAISVSGRTFIRDVEEASRYYSALNSLQKAAIPQYLYIQLQNYIDGIANMRAVEERLLALNTNDWNYLTTYQSVMLAYNALPYDYRALLSSQATAKMKEYELYYSVEHNRATSQTVITAISKLTTSSAVTEVQRVRTLYNNLTVYQKTLVTNIKDLIYIEDVLKTPSLGWDPYYELYNDVDEEEEIPTEIDVTQSGNTYKIAMPVSDMNRYTATTISVTDNVTLKIPRSAIPRSNDSAVVAMTLEEVEGEAIVFTASLYNENLNFSSYIDIEVKGLPRNAVILRLDENGEYVAAPYSRVLNKHVIKTKTSNEFIVSTNNVVFYDIQTDGHRSQIEELAKRKIVTGVEKNYFRPSANVTVAQFSAMISRAMALTATESSSYGDVQGKWYESSIQALLEAGILEEKTSNRFNPEQVVTRKQAAMMAIRMLEHAGVSVASPDYRKVPFTDLTRMSSNERYYAALAYEFGIFGGKENGKFDPNAKLTRSQMAKVLHRTLQIAKML